MPFTRRCLRPSLPLLGMLCVLLVTTTGCVGFLAQLVNVGWGNRIPANFSGLQEKRVAIVCMSGSSAFGPSSAADEIARSVRHRLRVNVPKIEVIPEEMVADWMDRNDWNELDYRELGQGVKADMIVAVDLANFSLHEGKTLFRGRADVAVSVYDITQGGEIVFEVAPPEIVYPATTGQYTAETSEADFRRQFVDIVSHRVARNFYAYDATSDFGQDALILGN